MMRLLPWLAPLALAVTLALPVRAATDPLAGAETVTLELGGEAHPMRFVPGDLELRAGQLYRLVIINRGPVAHEFDAPRFVVNVDSVQLDVFSAEGAKVAELVGRPDEIVLMPAARAEWYLTPIEASDWVEMLCDVPGHLQAGMRGRIRVR